MKRFFILLSLLVVFYGFSQNNYVVLVSLDGFRYDYIKKYNATNMAKIAKKGVQVKRLVPSNPTKTFPNHYTLATGLYPDNHGIIGNAFYAPDLKKEYAIRNRTAVENGNFYKGEPIWNTAKKAGLKTASYFWVGTEAKINGMQPDIWKRYDGKVTFEQRIDSVMQWLKLPEKQRPRLITLYYDEPDSSGHRFGPDSKEVEEQVRYVDKKIGDLYKRLMKLPFAENISFIVLSDHGMRSISKDKQIILADHINKNQVVGVYGSNPVYTIKVKPGKQKEVYKKLKKVKKIHVYKRNNAPKKYKFANNIRTNDLIIVGKKGYSVFATHAGGRYFGGTHGYLNSDKQMSAIFLATGKGLKRNYTKRKINNVDVYNLIAHLLEITPAKNDGNFNNIKPLLKK